MVSIKATIREKTGNKNEALRVQGILPAVLYGEDIKNSTIEVSEKDFDKVYAEAGESSLVSVELDDKKYDVLIHQTAKDPLTERFLHVDFYKPSTKKKVEVEIHVVFEGESLAVKDLGGILVREIQTLHVKGLAHNLPREITVNISTLGSFEDRIYVSQLSIPEGVEILRNEKDIVALVVPPTEEKEEEVTPTTEEGEVTEDGEAVSEEALEKDGGTSDKDDAKNKDKS